MSGKAFNYAGTATIRIEGPSNLLERIAANIDGEQPPTSAPDCSITIQQSPTPSEIVKDKRFPYLTLEKCGTSKKPSVKYTRYNTHVRTIHQESPAEYHVEANVSLDEASGLICIRNYLSNHQRLSEHPLLHASLITFDGRGVLIAGGSRQGKTASTVYFLEEGATFVGDENIILDMSRKQPNGLYAPRTQRVRFSTIAESRLSAVLRDVRVAEATQYIDPDAIQRIIETESYHVDAGMAFSRRAFCELLGTTSTEKTPIDLVVFPKYANSNTVNKRSVEHSEGVRRLALSGLGRKSDIDPKELADTRVNLSPNQFSDIEFMELEFSGIPALREGGVRL